MSTHSLSEKRPLPASGHLELEREDRDTDTVVSHSGEKRDSSRERAGEDVDEDDRKREDEEEDKEAQVTEEPVPEKKDVPDHSSDPPDGGLRAWLVVIGVRALTRLKIIAAGIDIGFIGHECHVFHVSAKPSSLS